MQRLIDISELSPYPIDITDLPGDKCLIAYLADDVDNAPTVLTIPDNPTNGNMVKTVFDDYGYNLIKERLEHFKWWNAPYKRGDTDGSKGCTTQE